MFDPLDLVNRETNSFETILNSIVSNKCVLVLGPLFGEDQKGEKIAGQMAEYLKRNIRNLDLDPDYQNLFIHTGETQELVMANAIKKFYRNNVVPFDLYRDIARINFSAILNFSQDPFLNQVFQELQFDVNFEYHSLVGTQQEADRRIIQTSKDEQRIDKSETTVLYNLYGCIDDPQSLIVSYTAFYSFLFAILGEPNFFPKDLFPLLTNAEVMLFLGFDLKKWYVPLLINKLVMISGSSKKAFLVSTMNDSQLDNNEEYIKWLGRYPIKMNYAANTQRLVDDILTADPKEWAAVLRKPAITKKPVPVSAKTINEWIDQATEKPEIDDTLTLLMNMINGYVGSRDHENETICRIFKATIISQRQQHFKDNITYQQLMDKLAQLRSKLLDFLKTQKESL